MKKQILVAGATVLSFFALMLIFAMANIVASPAVADESLPPRPTLEPSTDDDGGTSASGSKSSVRGGFIILAPEEAQAVDQKLWTQVQWKANDGEWYDVDGWSGTFNQNSQVLWWVAAENLGAGPFRWVVYDAQESGQMIAMSDEFALPSDYNQNVRVTLPLAGEAAADKAEAAPETAPAQADEAPQTAEAAAPATNADTAPQAAQTQINTIAAQSLTSGGIIMLTLSEEGQPMAVADGSLWTQVQWQRGDEWIDVAGWRGYFNDDSEVVWWVAPEDLGAGPYRWVVYAGQGSDTVLAMSDTFLLPSDNGQGLWVNVDVLRNGD